METTTPPSEPRRRGRPKGSTKVKADRDKDASGGGAPSKMRGPGGEKRNTAADESYTHWKQLVPLLYDWLASHNLVWPSLSCRFVEIMAPVFSREAWRCVWHMIQNDLVHGWGLDFALRRCVDPAHEKIGVVDSQWIVHQVIPSLGSQGEAENGKAPWQGVRDRCKHEWAMFQDRLAGADKAYFSQLQQHH